MRKNKKLSKQIHVDECEVKIRALEDTSTTRLDDEAHISTCLSMDQPQMTMEDKSVNKNVNSSSGNRQKRTRGGSRIRS